MHCTDFPLAYLMTQDGEIQANNQKIKRLEYSIELFLNKSGFADYSSFTLGFFNYIAKFSEHGKYQLRHREVREVSNNSICHMMSQFFFHRLESQQVFYPRRTLASRTLKLYFQERIT